MRKYKIVIWLATVSLLAYSLLTINNNGRTILNLIENFQSIISMLIVVAGWFFTYYFNNKVQDRRLKNDITNTARKEITQASREYQEWLNHIHSHLLWVKNSSFANQEIMSNFDKWNSLYSRSPSAWNTTLENYAILFPETQKVRVQLQDRDIEIGQMLLGIHEKFLAARYTGKIDGLMGLLNQVQDNPLDYISDQICLMIDLNTYLQNKCLGEITGNAIPARLPRDPMLPLIEMNDGMLEIKNNRVGITKVGQMIQKVKKDNNYPY